MSDPGLIVHGLREERDAVEFELEGKGLKLTHLDKVYWPDEGYTKRDLLGYYAAVGAYLLPHLADRAMVMKRYPDGIAGKSFFMKRTPEYRPDWLRTCRIEHRSGNVIDFPIVGDMPSLLWIVNLGCIDLNPWYARCGDVNRPDYLHFDLDPVENGGAAPFRKLLDAALAVREHLMRFGMDPLVKTTGSRGLHVYVGIEHGPVQKEVWTFAKRVAFELAAREPRLLTAEYRVAKRPAGRVIVDYNQNAWGRTLASIYSVRPRRRAPVSAPLTWDEVETGVAVDDYRMDNMPALLEARGDLWRPLTEARGRFRLERAAGS